MLTTILLILTLILIAVAFTWAFTAQARGRHAAETQSARFNELVQLFEGRLNAVQEQLDRRLKDQTSLLADSQGQIGKRLDNAAHVVSQVQNRLGQLDEANKRIFDVGKDIRGLQDILQAPKLRGGLGELMLEELLAEILPRDRFQLQYTFKSNEKVDAVICLAHGLVSVDAKFPLENFKRYFEEKDGARRETYYSTLVSDTKKHVDAIASKYIVPDEGTLEFAFMYIPAENVYYELAVSDYRIAGKRSLIDYAHAKRVIPVSPNTFFAYLQTVLIGLRGLKIEERARAIQDLLSRLRLDFGKMGDDLRRLGTHLKHASGSHEESIKRFERIQGRMGNLEEGEPAAESAEDGRPIPIATAEESSS